MAVEKPCPAIFITGTDTGVGKTLVAAALARHFSSQGLRVGVMKPIETGVTETLELGADAALLRWAGLDAVKEIDRNAIRERELDRLADCLEQHLDMSRLFPTCFEAA